MKGSICGVSAATVPVWFPACWKMEVKGHLRFHWRASPPMKTRFWQCRYEISLLQRLTKLILTSCDTVIFFFFIDLTDNSCWNLFKGCVSEMIDLINIQGASSCEVHSWWHSFRSTHLQNGLRFQAENVLLPYRKPSLSLSAKRYKPVASSRKLWPTTCSEGCWFLERCLYQHWQIRWPSWASQSQGSSWRAGQPPKL